MTESDGLVSVIVPTRNSGRTIRACLESIRSQTYRSLEVIVVDNGSKDQTLPTALLLGDVVERFGPERSAQRNRGAQIAHGEYLLFIDSDMILAPDVIGECLDAVKRNRAPAVVIREVSVGEGFIAHCRALERACYADDDTIEAARFYRRKEFDDAGGFDEQLVAFEDWDLSSRIAGGRVLPRTTSFISHDEGKLLLRTLLMKKRYYAGSYLLYFRKHGRKALGQANLILRPAFLRNWRRLLRHPVLTVGFVSLKAMETAAGFVGVVETFTRTSGSRGSKHVHDEL
jgi:glycosyltransferase involved in cell wall biosynthesis